MQAKQDFLRFCNLENLQIIPQTADASTRRYFRLAGGDKPYLLMEAPPPHDIKAFTTIAEHLRKLGLSAPETYQQRGDYLLLQDFGDDSVSSLLREGANSASLYEASIDILLHLHSHASNASIDLPIYSAEILYNEAELFPLWYMQEELSIPPSHEFLATFRNVIIEAVQALPELPSCLVMRDYHIDNLMQVQGFRIGEDSPQQACGLLDFQDALLGSPAYDVMSILEDARIEVPEKIQHYMIKKYLQAMQYPPEDFALHYSVLACIRHLKVLGIFVRLAVRDNKPHYRKHLPHVKKLLQKHLQQKQWKNLQNLLQKSIPDF